MGDAALVFKTYGNELEGYVEQLADRSWNITAAAAKTIEDELTSTDETDLASEAYSVISDTTDVDTPRDTVVEVFAWASITTIASMIGTFLGYTILSPFVVNAAEKYSAFILSYLILPLLATFLIRKYDRDQRYVGPRADAEVRYLSMLFAFLQGIFSGRIVRNLYVSAQPLPFVTPASIAVAFAYMPVGAGKNRVALLSTSLSFAMAMNIVIGAVMNWLTLAYYSLSICYLAVAYLILQLTFPIIQKGSSIHVLQHWLVSFLIDIKGIFFILFGSYAYT